MTVTEKVEIPLHKDEHGVYRIGDTRVTLDTVISAFDRGATPEEIVQQFPSLDLADVYGVIGYFLQNQEEVREYLDRRNEQAESHKDLPFVQTDHSDLRERLMARKQS